MKVDIKSLVNKYKIAEYFKQNKSYEKFFVEQSQLYNICIFGGGMLGRTICRWLLDTGISVEMFCDNDLSKQGKYIIDYIKCISFDELNMQKENTYVIVAIENMTANIAVNKQLRDFEHVFRNPLGISIYLTAIFDISAYEFASAYFESMKLIGDEQSKKLYEFVVNLRLQDKVIDYDIETIKDYYSDKQYIVEDLVDYKTFCSYIDCGAYVGDSLELFIEKGGSGAMYYCFEMDKEIYQILNKNIREKYSDYKNNIKIYPYGVGEQTMQMTYIEDDTGGSRLDNNASKKAQIIALDDLCFETKIDFLKMDIEGAEQQALRGSTNLIRRDKPVLAISMYHSFRQIVELPQIIRQLDDNYHMYIRHHKHTIDDTVLYAIWEESIN